MLSEASLNEIGLKPNNRVDYPWTTYGERLKQITIHELGGHGVKEYATEVKANHDPKIDYYASGMSIFGGIPLDTYHPILSSFAKVNGWKLVAYRDYLTQWGDLGKQTSEELVISNPGKAAWPVWDRDPQLWGEIQNRKIRLDPYASYGTINETFATFFMFWSMSEFDKNYDKSLLTRDEIRYFDRMFHRLSQNPEKYIQQLIKENPGPVYNPDLFENQSKNVKKDQKIIYKSN